MEIQVNDFLSRKRVLAIRCLAVAVHVTVLNSIQIICGNEMDVPALIHFTLIISRNVRVGNTNVLSLT
jgi:hypothetical protein